MTLSLQFPNNTYSTNNRPSVETLKGDLAAIQSDVNTTEATVASLLTTTLNAVYPVGSYYANGAVSTNPATLLGIGTWIAIGGKVIVGQDVGQTEFAALLQTGGEKTHLLTGAESGEKGHGHSDSGHTHGLITNGGTTGSGNLANVSGGTLDQSTQTGYANISSVAASNAASAHNNLQPYEVAALWRRTA